MQTTNRRRAPFLAGAVSKVDAPDLGELQMTLHVANGLFTVLDWITTGLVDNDTTAEERTSVVHELVIAGRKITDQIVSEF